MKVEHLKNVLEQIECETSHFEFLKLIEQSGNETQYFKIIWNRLESETQLKKFK